MCPSHTHKHPQRRLHPHLNIIIWSNGSMQFSFVFLSKKQWSRERYSCSHSLNHWQCHGLLPLDYPHNLFTFIRTNQEIHCWNLFLENCNNAPCLEIDSLCHECSSTIIEFPVKQNWRPADGLIGTVSTLWLIWYLLLEQ